MERVGFIGLGSMGVPMCRHILAHGFPLTVLDTHPQTVEQMVASGASAAADPEQVGAACDVVLVMVPSDEDVMEVITGATGILMGAEPGTVIAVCSSTLPETCAHAAEIASQKGVGLVDSPVARGVRGALAADLTVFAGGDPAHLDKCRPIFETFAGRVFYMGSVGKGQVTKTVNNLIHWVEVVGIYEALRLGLD
ncbi:MAG TPA: NAD(P)-dependent oxidoreductase, partial [Anaerolineales bacterium]|nr:NAD(P)-dependent oxidoreductase [Anaerolineales bacterium]